MQVIEKDFQNTTMFFQHMLSFLKGNYRKLSQFAMPRPDLDSLVFKLNALNAPKVP